MFSDLITQEEINLVEARLTFTSYEEKKDHLGEIILDENNKPIIEEVSKQNETAQQWYERNLALVGEKEAVRRFKNKANNQRLGK
jgi:hypothetical protein